MQFTDAIGQILAQAPGCADIQAVARLRQSLAAFCRETLALTEWMPTAVDADTGALDYGLTDGYQPVQIVDARSDAGGICVETLNGYVPPGPDVAISIRPAMRLTGGHPAVARLESDGDLPDSISVLLARSPGSASEEVPDWLWYAHQELLEVGALGRLLVEPGKTYTSQTLGAAYLQRFAAALPPLAARYGVQRTQQANKLRVKAYG